MSEADGKLELEGDMDELIGATDGRDPTELIADPCRILLVYFADLQELL